MIPMDASKPQGEGYPDASQIPEAQTGEMDETKQPNPKNPAGENAVNPILSAVETIQALQKTMEDQGNPAAEEVKTALTNLIVAVRKGLESASAGGAPKAKPEAPQEPEVVAEEEPTAAPTGRKRNQPTNTVQMV